MKSSLNIIFTVQHLNEYFPDIVYGSWSTPLPLALSAPLSLYIGSDFWKIRCKRMVVVLSWLYEFICKLNATELWQRTMKQLNEFPMKPKQWTDRIDIRIRKSIETCARFDRIGFYAIDIRPFYLRCISILHFCNAEHNLLVNPMWIGGIEGIKYICENYLKMGKRDKIS